MIEKLTIEKLNEYNFETDIIDRLLSSDDYEQYTFNDIGYFFASNVEQKIYSDKEALRKYYFKENEISFPFHDLDLIPEYYKLGLEKHLSKQKIYLKTIYNEQTEINEFKQLEIDNCNTTINYYKEKFKNRPKTEIIKKYKEYLKWLENKEPQQSKDLALNTDKNESKEPKKTQPTLKELALFYYYLGDKITKDNANEYLLNTPYKSGDKLKQNFDNFRKTSNRIYSGTDRNNNAKLKLFEKVILMLKKTDNKDAINKAEKELIQFEKNIV